MRELTQEQMQELEQKINNRIYYSDKYAIRELIQKDTYALTYFIDIALDNIKKIRDIKNIMKY